MDDEYFAAIREEDLWKIEGITSGLCLAINDLEESFEERFKVEDKEYAKVTPNQMLEVIAKSMIYGQETVLYLISNENNLLKKDKKINKKQEGIDKLLDKKKGMIKVIEELNTSLGGTYNTKDIEDICRKDEVPVKKVTKITSNVFLNSAYSEICKYKPQKTESGVNYLGK